MENNNKLNPITMQELIGMCRKHEISDKQMLEIKQKVDSVLKEFHGYKETLDYWENLYNKKKVMSN